MDAGDTALFTVEDIVYRTTPDGPLLARIYEPAGRQARPAIISVHGGRWCAESRLTNAPIDEALAAAGILVMAVDFRMPPEARYPLPVDDINFAISWLKQFAERRSIPAAWVGGLGASSGGHQLLLNALTPNNPAYCSQAKAEGFAHNAAVLDYVVACWPVSDPLARYHYAQQKNMDLHVRSHHAYWADETAMAEGSPLRIVSEGQAERLPPTLVIQGEADTVLTPDMADRFAEAYAKAGGEMILQKFAGEGHTFIIKDPTSNASREAIKIIAAFIHGRSDGRRAASP